MKSPSEPTETPRCDAAFAKHPVMDTQTYQDAILLKDARQLERELTAATLAPSPELQREAKEVLQRQLDYINRGAFVGAVGNALVDLRRATDALLELSTHYEAREAQLRAEHQKAMLEMEQMILNSIPISEIKKKLNL
jgi:hypothetical protein